jgi:hypothetical protein
MHEMANTQSFKNRTKLPSLLGLRVDVAIDPQARETHGCWSVRGARFIAIHDPFDRVTSTDAARAARPADPSSIWTLQDENASISAAKLTDRYYVNGLSLGWTSPTDQVARLMAALGNAL